MRKIRIIFLALLFGVLGNSCVVNNIEPVQVIENENSKNILVYSDILKPIVYKSNTYFIDLGTTGEMDFLNKNEVYFHGDYVISSPSKNLRVSRNEELADGSIIYVLKKNGEPINLSLEITNGTKFQLGFKYQFFVAEPQAGIKESKQAYKAIFEFTPSGNIAANDLFKNTEFAYQGLNLFTDISSGFTITYTTETIEEIKDGKIYEGKKIETIKIDGNINATFRGKYSYNKGEIKKVLLKKVSLGDLFIPGTIIKISPEIDIGIGFKGEGEINANFEIFSGDYTKTTIQEYVNNKWVEKIENSPKDENKWFNKISGSAGGEAKIGLYLDIITNFNKYIIPFSEASVAAGYFTLTAFGYTKISAATECEKKIELKKGVEFSFSWGLGVVDIDGKRELLIPESSYKIDNFSFESPLIDNFGNFNCQIVTPFNFDLFNPDIKKFKEDLKNKEIDFPIYEGNTPPSLLSLNSSEISSIWESRQFVIIKSNYTPDKISVLQKQTIDNLQFHFERQLNGLKLKTISIGNTNRSQRYNEDASFNPNITGSGNNFTIIGKCAGTIHGVDNSVGKLPPTYVNLFAISGTRNGDILENIHYIIFSLASDKCPDNQCLTDGTYRYYTSSEANLKL